MKNGSPILNLKTKACLIVGDGGGANAAVQKGKEKLDILTVKNELNKPQERKLPIFTTTLQACRVRVGTNKR